MAEPDPLPMSAAVLWTQVRYRFLPVLFFGIWVFATAWLWSRQFERPPRVDASVAADHSQDAAQTTLVVQTTPTR